MYSVILMAAMTAPADTASFGRGGCKGYACGGSSCNGSSCSGNSCSGCGGGRASGGIFGLRNSSCTGCGGSSVHGGGASTGYSFGGIRYGFAGCYGSCYGTYTDYFSYWSQPVQSSYGYGMPMRVGPPAKPATPPVKPATPPVKPTDKAAEDAAATVIISLPADATLFANGVRTRQTSNERHFVTPPLEIGMVYNYTLTIEVVRGGRMVTETRQVEVQAGAEIRVAFEGAEAASVAGK